MDRKEHLANLAKAQDIVRGLQQTAVRISEEVGADVRPVIHMPTTLSMCHREAKRLRDLIMEYHLISMSDESHDVKLMREMREFASSVKNVQQPLLRVRGLKEARLVYSHLCKIAESAEGIQVDYLPEADELETIDEARAGATSVQKVLVDAGVCPHVRPERDSKRDLQLMVLIHDIRN